MILAQTPDICQVSGQIFRDFLNVFLKIAKIEKKGRGSKNPYVATGFYTQ